MTATRLVRDFACDADVWTGGRSGIRAWLFVTPDGVLHADPRQILADNIHRRINDDCTYSPGRASDDPGAR
jgi:hypothetical protein